MFYVIGVSAYDNHSDALKNYGKHEILTEEDQQLRRTQNKVRMFIVWLYPKLTSYFPSIVRRVS